TYKTTFWQPQLLYIEAVYHIKQREDSTAKTSLQTIINQNSNPALTEKAQNLLSVLSRRRQIEDELNAYQMQNQSTPNITTQANDTTSTVQVPEPQATDTLTKRPTISSVQQQTAKKDPVTVKPPVARAIDSIAKQQATPKPPADTVAKKPIVQKPKTDTLVKKAPVQKPADTTAKKPVPPKSSSGYAYEANTGHSVVIILDKVDPVFVNEARNAFFRFNREKYSAQSLDAQIVPLTADIKLLLITGFASAQTATEYAQRAKVLAPSEIIPWLTGNKYTFTIISAPNLEVLKTKPDISAYKKFLEQHLPGKF
ncbi:MAG TPA: hypothetical protein VF609_07285, partial [Flavisolibacter sp.]